ncbi:AAA family ATPase [Sulfurimonas sp.]|uniref:AAA family ATPase n=1 Tax=Sulfurimonas sp. TaxID=2022749 RepID=UPI0025D3A974|nr:AAA family ATPase [Sulfurimonas sp.]MBW6487518.1 AAA family ATPase [Sulfurimonas sp.]
MTIKEKTQIIIQEMNNKLIEREHIVPMILLTLYSQQHMLLLGPPGVGKTYAIELIKHFVEEVKYFEYLITPTTTIEELFGTKITESDGSVTYNIEQSMLDSHIVFNDEIFKGPSQLLNSQLGITHSSRSFFQRGRGKLRSPMLSMFAASNELPDNDAVDAFDDRLLFRFWVNEISDSENFKRFAKREFDRTQDFSASMTIEEIKAIRVNASEVFIHDDFVGLYALVKEKLKAEKVRVSDRKLQSSLDIFQVSAYINGRDYVDLSDLFILLDIAWKHYDDISRTKRVIFDTIFGNPSEVAEVLKANQDAYKHVVSKMRSQISNVLNYSYNFYGNNADEEFQKSRQAIDEIKISILTISQNIKSLKDNYLFAKNIEGRIERNIFLQNYKDHIYHREDTVGEKKVSKDEIFELDSDITLVLRKLEKWLNETNELYDYNNQRALKGN